MIELLSKYPIISGYFLAVIAMNTTKIPVHEVYLRINVPMI